MSKAILVLDRMPNSCHECPLFNSGYTDMCCKGMNYKTINYPYPKDFRQEWCPLKAVPERESVDRSCEYDYCDECYTVGWNDCLNEILGED